MPAYLVVFLEKRLSHVHRRDFDGANSVTLDEDDVQLCPGEHQH